MNFIPQEYLIGNMAANNFSLKMLRMKNEIKRPMQSLYNLGMPSKKKKSKLWDIGPKGGEGSKPNPKC